MKHAKLRSFTFILVAFMLGCNEFMVVAFYQILHEVIMFHFSQLAFW